MHCSWTKISHGQFWYLKALVSNFSTISSYVKLCIKIPSLVLECILKKKPFTFYLGLDVEPFAKLGIKMGTLYWNISRILTMLPFLAFSMILCTSNPILHFQLLYLASVILRSLGYLDTHILCSFYLLFGAFIMKFKC